jgi:hypothetical protein
MTKLVWDPEQAPPIKRGVDRGVLYFRSYGPKVWNGLEMVNEKPGDWAIVEGYYDGQKFAHIGSPESYSATIDSYTYPDELESGDVFDLSYRVSLETGYELHIVWNAEARETDVAMTSLGSDAEAESFSWDVSTIPNRFDFYRATAHILINSTNAPAGALEQIEDLLYGTTTTSPSIPSIEDIFAIFDAYAVFIVTDNGDGTWTATGPDSWFQTVDATTVIITTPSVDFINSEAYLIRSW